MRRNDEPALDVFRQNNNTLGLLVNFLSRLFNVCVKVVQQAVVIVELAADGLAHVLGAHDRAKQSVNVCVLLIGDFLLHGNIVGSGIRHFASSPAQTRAVQRGVRWPSNQSPAQAPASWALRLAAQLAARQCKTTSVSSGHCSSHNPWRFCRSAGFAECMLARARASFVALAQSILAAAFALGRCA